MNEAFCLLKTTVVFENELGFNRSAISASAGKYANFLIEIDSTDYGAKSEALKVCAEAETAVHPGDWPSSRFLTKKQEEIFR